MKLNRLNSVIWGVAFTLFAGVMVTSCKDDETASIETQKEKVLKFGLPIEDFSVKCDTLRTNETLTELIGRFGFSINDVYNMTQCPDSVFNERKLRPGQVCHLFSDTDSVAMPRFLVYEENLKDFVVFASPFVIVATRVTTVSF